MVSVTLLGPQRLQPTVSGVIARLGIEGPVAVVTAGWQEREDEDEELRQHLPPGTVNLELYRLTEELFAEDADLAAAYRERQDRLREQQELYRLRLRHAIAAAREMLGRPGDSLLLDGARAAAIETVRSLDAEHRERLRRIHSAFAEAWRPGERPGVVRRRREVAGRLAGCAALVVAGGHVAVLLNRLRLFDLAALVEDRPIVAWSAGAMALAELLVVFHDSPPQGPGNAEALEDGLGLCPGLLPLPHARRRLNLGNPLRVQLLSRRFRPLLCLPLDEGSEAHWDGKRWSAVSALRRLAADGRVPMVAPGARLPAGPDPGETDAG